MLPVIHFENCPPFLNAYEKTNVKYASNYIKNELTELLHEKLLFYKIIMYQKLIKFVCMLLYVFLVRKRVKPNSHPVWQHAHHCASTRWNARIHVNSSAFIGCCYCSQHSC